MPWRIRKKTGCSYSLTAELKHQGFRWAPKAETWQRQLNQQAINAAGRIDFVKPLTGQTVQELQPKAEKKNKRKEAEVR